MTSKILNQFRTQKEGLETHAPDKNSAKANLIFSLHLNETFLFRSIC